MTAKFSFNDTYGEEFKLINEHGTADFTKYRLKSKKITVDVALTEVENPEEYIDQRKDDYRDMELRVPSPYTSDITEKKQDENYPIEFDEKDNTVYGLGYAGPEYKVMLEDQGQIPRYRYVVTWTMIDDQIAEVELYIPKNSFELGKALEFVESMEVN